MSKITHHVIRGDAGHWVIKKEGATRATRTFSTQADAISYARSLSKSQHSELVIHSSDGRISRTANYSADVEIKKGK